MCETSPDVVHPPGIQNTDVPNRDWQEKPETPFFAAASLHPPVSEFLVRATLPTVRKNMCSTPRTLSYIRLRFGGGSSSA